MLYSKKCEIRTRDAYNTNSYSDADITKEKIYKDSYSELWFVLLDLHLGWCVKKKMEID